jgi:hypothetical protein
LNEAAHIAQTLAQIEGIGSVTRGWPKQTAKLPCAAVGLDDESAADTRDNAVYLVQRVYGIRVFAATMSACDAIGESITAAMEALGYTMSRTQEIDGETAQQKLTFQKLF